VATYIANRQSIHLRHHGPELNPENAIGTTDYYLGHVNLESDGESKNKLQSSVLSPLLSPSVTNEVISEWGPFVMAHLCRTLARECHITFVLLCRFLRRSAGSDAAVVIDEAEGKARSALAAVRDLFLLGSYFEAGVSALQVAAGSLEIFFRIAFCEA
jgi:hypothetical protein